MSEIIYYDEFVPNKNNNFRVLIMHLVTVLLLSFIVFIMISYIKKFMIISFFTTNVIQQLFLEGIDFSLIVFIFSLSLFEPIFFVVIFIIASFIVAKYTNFPLVRSFLVSIISFIIAFTIFHIGNAIFMLITDIGSPQDAFSDLLYTIVGVIQNTDPISDIVEITDIIISLIGNFAYYLSYQYLFLDSPSILTYFITFYIGKAFLSNIIYDFDYIIIIGIYIPIFYLLFVKFVKPCKCNSLTIDKKTSQSEKMLIKGIYGEEL